MARSTYVKKIASDPMKLSLPVHRTSFDHVIIDDHSLFGRVVWSALIIKWYLFLRCSLPYQNCFFLFALKPNKTKNIPSLYACKVYRLENHSFKAVFFLDEAK
jgi:hypothetical protein